MTHLKKIFLALAVAITLGFLGANSANAQTACNTSAATSLVRSQGLTELTGNVTINCGAAAVLPVSSASITLTIQPATAVVTNDTTVLPTVTNVGGTIVPTVTISGNTVTINLCSTQPVPAAGCPAANGGATLGTLTIAGIRVNANASGVVFPAQIAALLTANPPNALTFSNNSLNVAIPQSGFTGAISAGAGLPQCSSATFAGLADAPAKLSITPIPAAGTFALAAAAGPGGSITTIANKTIAGGTTLKATVTEGYASAFLTKADENPAPLPALPVSTGTRFVVNLTGLPSNIVLYAPEQLVADAAGTIGTLNLTLVANSDSTGSNGATPVAGNPALADQITGSSVVYEVTADDNANATGMVIPIQLYTYGTPSPTGTVAASVSMAPTSTIGTATTNVNIPRFAASPATGTATSVIPCVTNVLFPFVSNQLGFDTGFALANTTSDPFGTSGQSGTCVYNFYGQNPPSGGTFTTGSVAAGATDVQVLSAIAKGFQGYVIAQCNFQLGHGFNFIISGPLGASGTVGMGGPGLIILQPGTTGTTSRKGLASGGAAAAPPFGEALGH